MTDRPHPERLLEAVIFASRDPVPLRTLATLLPDTADLDATLAAIRAHYQGGGIELVETGQGVMFRTAPDLAPDLKRIVEIPRRLPRAALETLAIVAYHQPVTRAEIEDLRGVSLSQTTLDALLEADLVTPAGHKEAPGRPTLWATTPHFLTRFGLKSLRDLPKRNDLLVEPVAPAADPEPATETPAL
ncbi:SMC-Scp complex subunit ScpB [Acidiphilium sp.]|uniref:SMC-Scp complex subunit ScpB n=1 Tax=Acidiphilium sp. TaxID=527 RepID=UPI003D078D37